MNDDSMNNLFQKMKAERLSAGARSRLRERILARIREGSVPTYREFSFVRFIWASPARRAYVGVLSVLVISFGVASFAAEGALPGDALYTMKTGVNEPIRKVLALSSKAKAGVEVELADRRLFEALELESSDRLDDSMREKLFDEAAKHAASLRVVVAESSDDLDEQDIAKLTSAIRSSRDTQNKFSKLSTGLAESEREATPSSGETMMLSAPALSAFSSSAVDAEESGKAQNKTQSKSGKENTSSRHLSRLEEEYDKTLQVLDERRLKIASKKKPQELRRGLEDNQNSEGLRKEDD